MYTLRTWGEMQAQRHLDLLEPAVIAIEREPTSGRSRDAIRAGYWSKSVEHHVLFYTFSDTEVRIRRILHEAMDFEAHIADEL